MTDPFVELVHSCLIGDRSLDRTPITRLDNTGTKGQPSGISKSKIIQSNDLVEVYDFEVPVKFGQTNAKRKFCRSKSIRSVEHRARSIIRALNTVRRLTHINFSENDKFITLTFNNDQPIDINDLSSCLPYYQKFIRKLRKKYSSLKFITVPEFQKRGAVHYHLLCNIPFIQKGELEILWPYGFSKPKAVKSSLHLALYLCKYLSKRFDDKRKEGHRLYYSSKNLAKPTIQYGETAEVISKRLKEHHSEAVQYERPYTTTRNGLVTYTQYQTKKS